MNRDNTFQANIARIFQVARLATIQEAFLTESLSL